MTSNPTKPLVVITGAAGGLAPAVARAFRSAGHPLALVTRPGGEGAVEGLAGELAHEVGAAGSSGSSGSLGSSGTTVATYGIDLASPSGTQAGFARIEAAQGPVGLLLNLAGGFAMGGPHDAGPELLQHMLTINLHTAVNATSAVLPGMLERGAGFVAAVGANAVLAPAPGMSAYAAAKGAVATYQRALAAEVGKHGVNAALLIPAAAIDTPGNRAAMPKADPNNWLDPAALAEALLYLAGTRARGTVHELVIRPH